MTKKIGPDPGVQAELSADHVGPGVLSSSSEAYITLGGTEQAPNLLALHSRERGVTAAFSRYGEPHIFTKAQGALCLTFDDCYIAQRAVINHMTANNQHATIFVTKEDVGGSFGYDVGHPNFINLDDLLKFQRAGHEIGNHTLNHVSLATTAFATQASQLDDLTTELEAAGIFTPTSFAYPFGYYNRDSDSALVSRGYRVRRYAGGPIHPRPISGNYFMVNASQLASDSVTSKPPGYMNIRDIMAWIDRAVTEPVIISLFCHLGPGFQYPVGSEPTVSEMVDLLDYARDAGVPCLTYREAFGGFNQIIGGGFEDDYDGWHLENYTAGTTPITTPADTPLAGLGGTQSLKITLANVADFCYIGQRLPVMHPGDKYHLSAHYKITGSLDAATFVSDDFSDTAANSWGTADTGGAWTVGVIGRAQDSDKAGGEGTIQIPDTTNVDQLDLLNAMTIRKDFDVYVKFKFNKWPSGANLDVKLTGRYTDSTHYVYGMCRLGAFGTTQLKAVYRNGGAEADWGTAVTTAYENTMFGGVTNVLDHWYGMRWQFNGTTARGKLWADDYEHERDVWDFNVTNASAYNTAGVAGVGLTSAASLTNSPITVSFDDYLMSQLDPNNAGIRLQVYELDPNGTTVNLTSSEQHKWNTNGWKQIALSSPLTLDNDTSLLEVRIDCRALAANFYVDNVVFDLNRHQPNGPLG